MLPLCVFDSVADASVMVDVDAVVRADTVWNVDSLVCMVMVVMVYDRSTL